MTSIGSFIKQIPLNNAYFRPVPDLAAGLAAAGLNGTGGGQSSISSYMYTINAATGLIGTFTPGNASTALVLQNGACLLKDMGTQYLSSQANGNASPIVFRRVQIVDPTIGGIPGNGLSTDGVSGNFTGAAAYNSDYNCAFILMGFNGAAPAGPFVRTG
jgi:hypothetical protein